MADAPLKVWSERGGALLRLRLARPQANLVDAEMCAALNAALNAPKPGLRGVILDHEGPHFSFGASVEEHLPERCAGMLKDFHALILKMLEFPAPILAAVDGQCLGGGLEVAMAGSLIFAAPGARLGQPEIKLAVFAPAASCMMAGRIGQARAEDLLLSGRGIGADEALAMGLVNAVADDPVAAALAYFDDHLAALSASSLGYALRAARVDFAARVKVQLACVEEFYLNGLMATHDAAEGIEAFIEKRPPKWKHR
jgi:cyclohexa-1,5-dienecarbonyl-CoA hydratase